MCARSGARRWPAAGSWSLTALTEPSTGSDAGSLSTRVGRDSGDFVINGAKAFISGGGDTDLLVVMAHTGGPGPAGVSAFAVPAESAGISYGRKEEKMGCNSQSTRPIAFEKVRVPARNLLGAQDEGFKIAMNGLGSGRIKGASISSPAQWARRVVTWTNGASSIASCRPGLAVQAGGSGQGGP